MRHGRFAVQNTRVGFLHRPASGAPELDRDHWIVGAMADSDRQPLHIRPFELKALDVGNEIAERELGGRGRATSAYSERV